MRLPALAVACAALLTAPGRAPAQSDPLGEPGEGVPVPPGPAAAAPAASDPAAEPAPAPPVSTPPVGPVRPVLLVGFGGATGGGGGGALSGDLGLRVAPWTARFAYRMFFSDAGYVTSASGRVGWIFAERSWAAVHVAAGAGRITYHPDAPGAASPGVPALTGELGVHFAPRWGAGPILALGAEAFAPLSRPSDPRARTMSGPGLAVTLSANPIALLLWRFFPWSFSP